MKIILGFHVIQQKSCKLCVNTKILSCFNVFSEKTIRLKYLTEMNLIWSCMVDQYKRQGTLNIFEL